MEALLKEINSLTNRYNEYGIEQSEDWVKYNYYSLVHHSTSIEGASLTQEETQVLLADALTAKGKPLEHHLMQQDHYTALLFVLRAAEEKWNVNVGFIKQVSSLIMKGTGAVYNTIGGTFDSAKGDLRLLNVNAGTTRFVDFRKVLSLLEIFCNDLNSKLTSISSPEDALITSFDAHFNLVSIHPFADGNGRISRLIMNFIQHYFKQPLSNVFKEDKAEYYTALVKAREIEDITIFRKFMAVQHIKMLKMELDKVRESQKEHIVKPKDGKGLGMSMIF